MASTRTRLRLVAAVTATCVAVLALGVAFLAYQWINPAASVDGSGQVATLAEFDRSERDQREAARLAATPEKFAELTSNSPLWEWWDFSLPGHPLRDQALAAMRELPRRQIEADAMLQDGFALPMDELVHLDLEATPVLCEAAQRFL